jgi:CIC family chloride channel protein
LRHIIFRTELYQKFQVDQLMTPVSATLGINDPMEDVMRIFEETHANVLPVVDVNNHLVGYVLRSRLYSMYRKMVADYSAD